MAIPLNPSPTIIIFFLLRLLIPCFLLPISHGQSTTNSQQMGQPSIYDLNPGFTSTTAVMIAILIVAFFFTAFFFVYIHRRRTAANNAFGNFLPATRSRRVMQAARNTGLDPAVIETFPTMVYSEVKGLKMGKSPLECAVCLCEFDEEEELTLLPKCDHAFHPQCIGMWLASHSTCPVCRANLAAIPAEPDLPTAENSGENLGGEEGGIRPTDQISIQVEEEREGLGRMAGMRSFSKRVLRPWRSRSARPTVGGGGSVGSMEKVWGEEERERFTLRLPEDVRKELVAGTSTLRRSASVAVAGFRGEESPRTGYSYRGGNGGRSYRFGRSVRAATKSGLLWGFAGEAETGSSKGKSVAPVVV